MGQLGLLHINRAVKSCASLLCLAVASEILTGVMGSFIIKALRDFPFTSPVYWQVFEISLKLQAIPLLMVSFLSPCVEWYRPRVIAIMLVAACVVDTAWLWLCVLTCLE